MYIKTIDIQNYHGIKELHVEFKRGVNLLIGNNGAGKTSLLNALSIILDEPLLMIHNPVQFLEDKDAYQTTSIISDTVIQTKSHYPVKIDSTVIWQNKEYLCRRELKHAIQSGNTHDDEISHAFEDYIAQDFNDAIGDGSVSLPILAFFPAQRGKLENMMGSGFQMSGGETQRSQGYQGAFSGAQHIYDIQQWCFRMDFLEYQRKQKVREYSEFQSIVSGFCSLIDEDSRDPKLRFSSAKGALVYFDGKDEKPIGLLSDGYQAAFCIGMELAYRAVILNPSMTDVSQKIEGVVLIDEIEMHMHPAWQWKILDALQQTFPRLQFIIATHSPIIVSSARDAWLLLMKSPNEVSELDNAYGYNVDDVLSLLQGTLSQPKKIEEYYELVEKTLEDGTEKELDKIAENAKEELKDSPTVLRGLLEFIEVNRWVEDT